MGGRAGIAPKERRGSSAGWRRNLGIAGRAKLTRPRHGRKQGLGLGDAARDARGLGICRQREAGGEIQVALDAQPAGKADGLDLGQAEIAEFGGAETEVGQPEQGVVDT